MAVGYRDPGGDDMTSQWLLEFCFDTYSQTGEDGVIAKSLSLLPETDQWCVEFGAWDGIHLSNVRKLIVERGHRAILIEADGEKCRSLASNYAGNGGVQTVNARVGFDAESGLDRILRGSDVPRDFDFLSSDIDGNDYHVWDAVKEYRPKLVCVEFNPTIPTEVYFVQSPDPRVKQGCSLLALDGLARAKGYQLVCVLPWNAFFVDERYFSAFAIADNRPHVMRRDCSQVTWLFSGYDGSVHLAGAQKLPWHGVSIEARRMQALPGVLRRYPADYTGFQSALFRVLKTLERLRAHSL